MAKGILPSTKTKRPTTPSIDVVEAKKELRAIWTALWLADLHTKLLNAAARAEARDENLPDGISKETISWHSPEVCDTQLSIAMESLDRLETAIGIEGPFEDEEVQHVGRRSAS